MSEQYKISLGVDVDVSDIQGQINSKAKDTLIPVKLDISNLGDIKKQIQSLGNAEIGISIDTNTAIKSAQQVGQNIGNAVTKYVQKNLNFDSVINKETVALMREYGISTKSKSGKVAKDEIKKALTGYYNEVRSGGKIVDSDIFGSVNTADIALRKVTDAIVRNKKEVIELDSLYEDLIRDIKSVNSGKGSIKISLPDMRSAWGDDYKANKELLGAWFSETYSGKSGSMGIDSWVKSKNWSSLLDLDASHQDIASQLVELIKRTKTVYSGDELFQNGFLKIDDVEASIKASVANISAAEQKIVQSSNSATDTIVQNQQRQQEAIKASIEAKKAEIEQEKKHLEEIKKSIEDNNRRYNEATIAGDTEGINESLAQMDVLDASAKEQDSKIKTLVASLESAEQQAKQTANAIQSISKETSLIRDDVGFQKKFANGNQSAKEAQQYFQALLAEEKAVVSVKENFDNSIGDDKSLKSFTVDIQRATGEIEKLHYAMSSADNDNRFLYQGASVSDRNIEKLTEARIKSADRLQTQLEEIKTKYKDMGSAKPIKDSDHINALDKQYRKVEKAIDNVRNADNTMSASAISNVEKQKSILESMVREYRNAETIATSLRSKDIGTVKATYGSDLDVLIQKMKDAGVYTSGFEKGAENLRTVLTDATDPSGLVSFLNGFDKLEAGYKRVAQTAKSLTQTKLYGQKASGIESEINGWQRINPEINKFEAEIDGAKISVQSLLNELGQVKTKSDFQIAEGNFKAFKKAAESAGIALTETDADFNRLKSLAKEINSIEFKIAGLDASKNETEINELTISLNRLHKEYENLFATTSKNLSGSQISQLDDIFEKAGDKLRQLDAQIADTKAKLAKGIKADIELGNFDNEIDAMRVKFNSLSDANNDLRRSVELVENAYKAMLNVANANTGDEVADRERLIEAEKKYAAALEKTNNLIKIQARADKIDAEKIKLQDNREVFQAKIDTWMAKNSAATKKFGAELLDLRAKAEKADQVQLNHLEKELTKIDKAADKAGLKMMSFGDRIKSKAKEYMAYFSVAEAFMYVTQAMKDMFEQVKLIDSAMTELKKVTNETDAVYNQFLSNAASRAKEIGTTIDGLVSSTADFARLGYNISDSTELAEVANIYAVVGDEIDSVETATKSLISTMTAFGIEASDSMSIVDKFNAVGNNFAISSGGIGDALERSASSMAAANNSLDETIALITAANTVVQDADAVGTAFKTISMRIRGAKTDLEDAGLDTEGMASSTAKLREEIMALSGVDIMLDSTTFKSTYKIMEELAAKWEHLTDIQQASVTELIAGKRQGNIVSSLMTNFDIAQNALQTSLGSSGSAMEEHAKAMESIELKLNSLKAAWQSFAQTFMSSDLLKGGIDALRVFVELLEKLVDNFGLLGTIGLGTAGTGVFKYFTKFKENFDGISEAIDSVSDAVDTIDNVGDTVNNVTDVVADATGAMGGLTKATSGTTGAFKAFMKTPIGVASAIGVAVAAIGLVVNAYKNAKEAAATARQEAIQASNEFLEASSNFEQAYIKYSGRTDLTSEEEAELASAINGTVDALGDKSSALQQVVNSSNDYVASLEAITDAELKAAEKAAQEKQKNAKLELEDATKDWYTDNTAKIQIKNDSDALEIAKEMDTEFFHKETKGKKGYHVATYWFDMPSDADADKILDYYYTLVEYKDKLLEVDDFDVNKEVQSAYEDVNSTIEKLSETVKVYEDGLYDLAKAEYQAQNGIPKTTAAYLEMREAILTREDIARTSFETRLSILNSLDSEYANIFDLSSAEAQARKFVGIIEDFGDGTKDGTNEIGTVETFLNIRTAVNSNECTVGEYLSELDNVKAMTVGWSDKEREEFNLSFGIDTDSIKSQYDDVYNYISRNYLNNLYNDGISNGMTMFNAREYRDTETERIQSLLDSLSMTELQAVASIKAEIDWKTTSTDEILKQIKEEAKFLEAMNYTIAIDVEAESLEAVNTAMAESVSGAGLSSEAITALKGRYAELESEGYSLSDMFEETANGIHLNREAVGELEQKLASNKLTETDKQLKVLKGRYDELTNEINDCRDAGDKAALYTEQQSIVDKINDLATLASQYRGLTSAYNAWQNAESAGSERDMYESVIEGFENIGDEISRGWIDDGTIKFLELLTGKTGLAGKSGKDLKKIYDDLDDTIKNTTYSVRDFFTVDEDGNSTNTGVYNFLDAISQLEKTDVKSSVLDKTFKEIEGIENLVKKDENGNIISFDFGIVGGDEAIADALGISEELVQIMVRAADDAGFVVDLEGAYTQLADLKTEAESARDTLISLQKNGLEKLKGVDIDFNFEAEGQDLVDEQAKAVKLLDKFKKDGKIDLKVEGAQQALDIAEYLTIKLDDLTEPKIMQIDVSEVDEDLRDPIEKMQEIVKLSKEKNLVSLTGDKKEIKETQNEINKVAEELEELKPEIKAKVGIDDKWDAETIASKIEKGEVEIPASLELDVQMSDDLKDMRLMMMNQLGLVSDDEVKLKIGFDIDDSTVSELTDEQKEVAVKYIVENEDEFNKYTEEEKETVVKLIADGVDLERYEAEDKEAIVNYIANGEEADGWTPEAKDAFVKYLADGGEIDKFDPENKDSWVVYDTDTTKPDSYEADDENATVTYDKDSSVPDGYDPNDPDATVTYKKDTSDIDGYNPPNFIRTVTYKVKEIFSNVASGGKSKAGQRTGANPDGKGGVNGTANVNGTTGRAFKQGSWGTKDSGTALVGELGREVLIRDGRYFTVGDYGAEFIKYQRGDIILNHIQSEELFKNGKVTSGGGRAKALASGTAFSKGSGGLGKVVVPVDIDGNGGVAKTTTKTSTKSSKNKTTTTTTTTTTSSKGSGGLEKASGKPVADKDDNKSSSSSSASKDFKETFDWIEVKINRIERAIDQLDQKANNVYKSWSSRNSALASEIGKVRDEIEIQQAGYERYLKEANSVGLSSSWAEKVREGKIDINTIKDEKLAEKIRDFQTWYEKALDCKDAIEELKEQEAKLYAQRVENVATQYEGILGVVEHEKNILDEYISQSEANAQLISVNYYNALAKNERENLAKLEEEKAKMLAEMQVAMDSGTITEGSEAWYDLVASIDEVTLAIAESNTQLIEYAQTIQQISWENFDLLQEKISAVTEETEFLIELLSSDKLFKDGGQLTDSGKATMGQHGVAYNTYMYQADLAAEEVERLKKQLEEDPYDTELEKRYREMVSLQQEYTLSAQKEKEAIRDLVSEGIELEIEALEERIDKYNEALDSQKELYDYQKRVKEQTEEIASLEKQMAAYSGDNSEEAKAKIQELKVSLDEAKTDLQETEYDKYLSDTQQMLDDLTLQYSEILNTRLDNLDALVSDMIAEINSDSTVISDTIRETADSVGYTLSDSMTSIWDTNSTKINDVITVYGEKFSNAQTTTNNALSAINTNLQNMITQLNSIAKTNVKSASTSSAAKSKEANPKKETPKKETPKKDTSKSSTIKVGGKINAKGAKIYDYVGDKSGERQLYRNDPIYKVLEERNGYLKTRWHKLSKGVTGWFKKGDVKAYATGKQKFLNNETAWTQDGGQEFIVRPSDGAILTPIARGDSVLTSAASKNIWDMANSPAEFIKDNLNLGSTNVPNNSNVQSVYHQTIENVTFDFKNVKNYEEMLCSLRDDRRFEKLVTAMTINRIAGKSALAKGKSIRN